MFALIIALYKVKSSFFSCIEIQKKLLVTEAKDKIADGSDIEVMSSWCRGINRLTRLKQFYNVGFKAIAILIICSLGGLFVNNVELGWFDIGLTFDLSWRVSLFFVIFFLLPPIWWHHNIQD